MQTTIFEQLVAVIRDETSRFQGERNLRKRLAELEAQAGA
ncbi:hypothetical protein P3T21_007636 [Paraburkholderia sp. GAS334]|jgi:hypothetical protein